MMQTTTRRRTNRLLLALAAAWVAISLALGGTVSAEVRSGAGPSDATLAISR